MKKNYGSYLYLHKMFPSFWTFGQQCYKKSNREKIQKFTRNKFSKVFMQIPGTYKKTSGSYRYNNKCSKWFHKIICFWCLNNYTLSSPGNNEKNFVPRNFLQAKILSQVFRTNLIYFLHCLLLHFMLNKTCS